MHPDQPSNGTGQQTTSRPRPGHAPPAVEPAPRGVQGLLVVLAGLPLVVLIGLLDHWSRHRLSLALLYQVPVALAAWRGGFPGGVLLALAATAGWHQVDVYDGGELHTAVALWNGVV